MSKYLVKIVVFTISILTANLIGDLVSNYLTSYKDQYKPLTFTLIAMAIIVIIFFPMFELLDKWINLFSKKVVRKGKSFAGQYFGLFIVFFASISILAYFYVKHWYGIDIIQYLFKNEKTMLF